MPERDDTHTDWMKIGDKLRQLVRFHRGHGLDYTHPNFGPQSLRLMTDEMEQAADHIDALHTAILDIHEYAGNGDTVGAHEAIGRAVDVIRKS